VRCAQRDDWRAPARPCSGSVGVAAGTRAPSRTGDAELATPDLTILGLGGATPGASEYLAEVRRRLDAQDRVGHRMHATGTSLEGEVADILSLVAEVHAVPFELGLPRVYTILKLDERRDRPGQTLDEKERAVERRLAEGA
jgi:uncharacterized protein (TIGR00106 family)